MGKGKKQRAWCERPDRHVPGIKCGYPLPCPHHTTVVMELRPAGQSPEIRTLELLPPETVQRLDAIGRALTEPKRGGRKARRK